MFIPSMYKSVQTFAGAGVIALGASVTMANTMISFGGNASADASGFPDGIGLGYVQLTAVNAVTATFLIGGGQVNGTVLEFYGGFLRQAVQYGVITLNGVTSNTQAITAVGPKAYIMYLGMAQNTNAAQADMASVTGVVTLTSNVLVTAARFGTGGVSSPDIAKIAYCVIDPK